MFFVSKSTVRFILILSVFHICTFLSSFLRYRADRQKAKISLQDEHLTIQHTHEHTQTYIQSMILNNDAFEPANAFEVKKKTENVFAL